MKSIFFVIYFVFTFNKVVLAQFDNFTYSTTPLEIIENKPFNITIELNDGEHPKQAILFYRVFGTSQFLTTEMSVQGNRMFTSIDAKNVIPPYIECYIKIINHLGIEKIYPSLATETNNFIRVKINKSQNSSDDIIILNPTEKESTTVNNFFLAFSVLRLSENINLNSTRLFINEVDVSSLLEFSGDLVYIPQGSKLKLNLGVNSFKIILLDIEGKILKQYSSTFQITSDEQKENFEKFKIAYSGAAEINYTNENLRFGQANYNRLRLNIGGNYQEFDSKVDLYLTNEEKKTHQPQNRFMFQINNRWLDISIGDHFPVFPNLILSGKRVRGISSKINVGIFNLQATYGEIIRKVEGELLALVRRDSLLLDPNLIKLDSLKYGQPYGIIKPGTYSRKLFAIRPYFGKGENFQLGFSYLHSKDDINSVQFNSKPKENLVVGTDLFIGFDRKRIQLNIQSSFSLLNNDITTGNISDATLDSIAKKDKSTINFSMIKKIRNIIQNFITVNEHLRPINPQAFPNLVTEANISFNYFGNYFMANYLYRGGQYVSFGQNYIRTDIKGFRLLDRISLFDNKVFFLVSYEKLTDNLQKTKFATTTFNNYESSLLILFSKKFPNLNLSLSNYITKNDIDSAVQDSILASQIVNNNIKVLNISSNYNFQYYIKHSISFSYIITDKNDFTFKKSLSKFNQFNISIKNIWNSDLQTFINTSLSNSKINFALYNYISMLVGLQMKLLENKLSGSASINYFQGDINRKIFDISLKYRLTDAISTSMHLRYIFNEKKFRDERIFNLLLFYEI